MYIVSCLDRTIKQFYEKQFSIKLVTTYYCFEVFGKYLMEFRFIYFNFFFKIAMLITKAETLYIPSSTGLHIQVAFTLYWIVKRSIVESVPDRASVHTGKPCFRSSFYSETVLLCSAVETGRFRIR